MPLCFEGQTQVVTCRLAKPRIKVLFKTMNETTLFLSSVGQILTFRKEPTLWFWFQLGSFYYIIEIGPSSFPSEQFMGGPRFYFLCFAYSQLVESLGSFHLTSQLASKIQNT